jgi:hypothetical protein
VSTTIKQLATELKAKAAADAAKAETAEFEERAARIIDLRSRLAVAKASVKEYEKNLSEARAIYGKHYEEWESAKRAVMGTMPDPYAGKGVSLEYAEAHGRAETLMIKVNIYRTGVESAQNAYNAVLADIKKLEGELAALEIC